jgi:Sap, sulfolipid-1-addressing protein
MWTTVLVMAIPVGLRPVLIGSTAVILNGPRPMQQLLAFLCGGFAMGTSVGLVALFILRHTLLATTNFTVPKVQIVMGLLALLVAAVLATNIWARQFTRGPLARATVGGPAGVVVVEPTPPSALAKLSTRARHLLRSSSLWVAGVVGLGMALPTAEYMAALAAILASGAGPAAQAGALLVFNVVAFALVEAPLLGYLAAPDKTRALIAALHDWVRSRRLRAIVIAPLLAAAGCFWIVAGVSGL